MTVTRDISTIDLDKGQTADIHTNVYVGSVLVAKVHATVMVLEAEDGHLSLMVDQNTEVVDDVRIENRYSGAMYSGLSTDDARGRAEDPG